MRVTRAMTTMRARASQRRHRGGVDAWRAILMPWLADVLWTAPCDGVTLWCIVTAARGTACPSFAANGRTAGCAAALAVGNNIVE